MTMTVPSMCTQRPNTFQEAFDIRLHSSRLQRHRNHTQSSIGHMGRRRYEDSVSLGS
jgi:hypothetical protein